MAVKSTTCQGTYGSKYILYMEYTLLSQDITNNKSRIRLHMYAQSISSQYGAYNLNSNANSYNIKVDGTTKVSGTKAMDFRNRQIVELGTWEGDITHNSDGTKTITIEGSFSISGTSSLSGGHISFTWTLTTIPRASDVTLSPTSANFGASITITHTRKSSNFTITLKYSFGSASGTIANKVSRDTTSWTIPNDLMSQIPNATSGKITITCETYNGSTLIGIKTATLTANVPSSVVPAFDNITHAEQNNSVKNLNLGKYLQGISQVKFTITNPRGAYGSTISSYKIEFEGKTYTTSSATATPIGTGSLTVKASITDSRGRTATKSITISVLAYTTPKFVSLSVQRNITQVNINLTANVKYLEGKNTCTIKVYSKERIGSSWTQVYSQTITLSNDNNFSRTITLNGYDIIKSYDFQIQIIDALFTTTVNASISTDAVPLCIGPTGIGTGKVWERGAIDAGGTVYITSNGNILQLIGQGHSYLSYYPRGYAEGRKGWIGYGSNNSPHLQMINEDDGDIYIKANNGNVFLNGINVLSVLNSALKDTGTTLSSETIDWATLAPGIYRVSRFGINSPPSDVYNYGMLLVTQTSTGVFQLYIPHSIVLARYKPYFRIKYDTSDWRDWMPLASGLLPELVLFTRDGTTGGSQTVPLSSGRVPSAIICLAAVQNPSMNYASWSMWTNNSHRGVFFAGNLFVPMVYFINIGSSSGSRMYANVNTVTASEIRFTWTKVGDGIAGTITGYLLVLYN